MLLLLESSFQLGFSSTYKLVIKVPMHQEYLTLRYNIFGSKREPESFKWTISFNYGAEFILVFVFYMFLIGFVT